MLITAGYGETTEMSEDNFYITLMSNVAHEIYDNKTSHFVTKLSSPLDLKGEWELGLSSVFLPNTHYNIDFRINAIKFFEYHRISDAADVNKEYRKTLAYTARLKAGFYNTIEDLVEEVKKQWYERWGDSKVHLTESSKKFRFTLTKFQALEMEPALASVLGFDHHFFDCRIPENSGKYRPNPGIYIHQGKYPIDINLHNNYAYIYCDIVKYSHIGNTSAPLLTVIPWLNTRKLNILSAHFESPDYIRVAKSFIPEILIELRDSLGRLIHFRSGSVVLKLHFRKCKPLVL